MTPLKVEILLHYYTTPGDYDPERIGCPAQQEAIREFLRAGVLWETSAGAGQRYKGRQDALKVYVEAILAVPVPHQAWVI